MALTCLTLAHSRQRVVTGTKRQGNEWQGNSLALLFVRSRVCGWELRMPIHCPITVNCLNAEEFEQVDYRVMGQAYTCQNELGRLCDEGVYEADVKARVLAQGFRSVLTGIPVTVTHGDFSKRYYLDLVADNALYEFKTDAHFVPEHDAQLLNYMFLLGLQRAKLLNFRSSKVQGKIVATSLTPEVRRLTAVTDDPSFLESHLRRLLALTNLKAIQWINLNHVQIEFTTVF